MVHSCLSFYPFHLFKLLEVLPFFFAAHFMFSQYSEFSSNDKEDIEFEVNGL